jgi:hypothetical protein
MNTKTFIVTISSDESLDHLTAELVETELIHDIQVEINNGQMEVGDYQVTVEEKIDPFA